MWTLLVLFALWLLSMYFYLPLPIIVVLFAALASGITVTIWFAWTKRHSRLSSISERDAKL